MKKHITRYFKATIIRLLLSFIVYFLLPTSLHAMTEEIITVDNCNMKVVVMQNDTEFQKGMLGYIDKTFQYDGMLFMINRNGEKTFHTKGMKMRIVIVGLNKVTEKTFITQGPVHMARPGLSRITVYGSDVLELPEVKYMKKYKACLNAKLNIIH